MSGVGMSGVEKGGGEGCELVVLSRRIIADVG